MTIRNLEYAFHPKSVAMIGASDRPGTVGRTVYENLLSGGFPGSIWPVNPRIVSLLGHTCFASVDALPETPDLGIIATPAATVPQLIAELGARGTKAAVVLSAGLSESNGLRQAMLDAGRPHCLRVIGPNCIGTLVPPIGLNASFAHMMARPGKLAFLSQSGALVGAVIDWAAEREIGFSSIVSMGDMADVDVGDMLDYLARDIGTSAILMYLETITNARKFMSAARLAARAKPVVVVKSGRHRQAQQAAATHTGALAGSDDVVDAAFRRAGLLRVKELEELFDAAESLTHLKPLQQDRLAILTNGGGAGVLAVDRLVDLNGHLAELAPSTIKRLDGFLPRIWSRANPVDIIGDANPQRYAATLEALLDDESVDAILIMNCPTAFTSPVDAGKAMLDVIERRRDANRSRIKPILANWLGDSAAQPAQKAFADAGIPSYASPSDAVRGFTYLTSHRKAQAVLMRTPPSVPEDFSVDAVAARKVMAQAAGEGRELLSEPEAKAVLDAYGIACVPTRVANNTSEVADLAHVLLASCEKVAVKILSNDISHKSDVGGVRLNLRSAEEARAAAEMMNEQIAHARPDASLKGFTVQEMVARPRAHELIVGITQDNLFGPVILFGAGGTSVEVVADRAVGLPPLDLTLARDIMNDTRIMKLLVGYRDRSAADIDAIALTLVRISQLIVDCPEVVELDINPLLADDNGIIALDARMRIDTARVRLPAPNPRLAIRPYPSEWEAILTTRSGNQVPVRPIRPSDEPEFVAFLEAMDPKDVRLRFLAPRKNFPHEFVARLTQIDYARAIAFVALDTECQKILGVARLEADPDYTRAEYAVMVRSDLKGAGLGWALMTHLIAYAKAEGLGEIFGEILTENTTMLHMADEFGFEIASSSDDPDVVRVRLDLTEP